MPPPAQAAAAAAASEAMDRSRMSTNAFERVSRVASRPEDAESIAVSLGATDLDIELVDNEVRRALAAIHGTKKETYAGRTNETEAGVSYLKKQLERLMKEKAQFKEKKLALQQLQQELPKRAAKYAERPQAAAPAPAPPAAAAAATAAAPAGVFLWVVGLSSYDLARWYACFPSPQSS